VKVEIRGKMKFVGVRVEQLVITFDDAGKLVRPGALGQHRQDGRDARLKPPP